MPSLPPTTLPPHLSFLTLPLQLNLGILAYVGKSEALVQIAVGGGDEKKVKSAGQAGFALWRSVYLSKQYGLRNRILVAVDWAKARVFGRDLSRL